MTRLRFRTPTLALMRILSSLAFALVLCAGPLRAHEVVPAIASIETTATTALLQIELNAEGVLSGIDLSAVADTDVAPQVADYDALRALSGDELTLRLRDGWEGIAGRIELRADAGDPLPLRLEAVTVADTPNPDLPRLTTLTLAADLPAGATALSFGWDRTLGAVVLRQDGVEAPYDGYLAPGEVSPAFAIAGGSAPGGLEIFVDYIPVGVDHIVPLGLDHILFVLALFFLTPRLGPLAWQISAFTLAHTITLALAALGIVRISGAIVEPLIAASIVLVAVENVLHRGLSPWRPVVIFGLGLLHGLGFASVLAEFGLPEASFVPALIGFNVGVELGQLLVIAVAAVIVWMAIRVDRGADGAAGAMAVYALLTLAAGGLAAWAVSAGILLDDEVPLAVFAAPVAALAFLCLLSVWRRDEIDAYRRIVSVPASVAIALVGAWWVVERVFL